MNSLWGSLYDWSKDRRYAALFLITLLIFLGVAIVGVILCLRSSALSLRLVYLLPGICVLVAALGCMTVRYLRAQHRDSFNHSPLSRDEWCKARSKLLNHQRFKKL